MSGCRQFALIGHPLGHSLSKVLFDETFCGQHRYRMLDIANTDNLRLTVVQHKLSGFNVTIPYKTGIIAMLDHLTAEAQEVGAVNCVRVESDGSLTGHNTDSEAFETDFRNFLSKSGLAGNPAAPALILGTGGAAKSAATAFRRMGIEYHFVSRNASLHQSDDIISYDEAYNSFAPYDKSQIKTNPRHRPASILVNATPVGMPPLASHTPWLQPELLSETCLVYDLIYNPSPTRLMREAARAGAQVRDGLEMLKLQARLSWDFWGLRPTDANNTNQCQRRQTHD